MEKSQATALHQGAPLEAASLPLMIIDRIKAKPERHARSWPWLAGLLLLAATLAFAAWTIPVLRNLFWQGTSPAAQGTALANAPAGIFALGRLRPASDVVAVAAPFGAGDARIADILVKEGSNVRLGDVLAVLDSKPALEAVRNSAGVQVRLQRALLEQTRYAVAANRDEAAATLQTAREALAIAELDFNRTAKLHVQGVVSNSVLDQKQSILDQANLTVRRAEITLARFDERDVRGKQELLVAESRVALAEADLERAERDIEKSLVRAPISGTVISLSARAGERPSQDGIATLADVSQMIAEVDVYQSYLGQVKTGQGVSLASDVLSKPLTGTVTYVGLEVRKQRAIDASPAANTDARVFEVQVTLDAESSARAKAMTNLQVTAHFQSDRTP